MSILFSDAYFTPSDKAEEFERCSRVEHRYYESVVKVNPLYQHPGEVYDFCVHQHRLERLAQPTLTSTRVQGRECEGSRLTQNHC